MTHRECDILHKMPTPVHFFSDACTVPDSLARMCRRRNFEQNVPYNLANKADSKQLFYKCPLIIWTVLTNKNEKVDKKMGKKLRISPIF